MESFNKVTIREVMSKSILTISPKDGVLDACKLMSSKNVGSAVVLDKTIVGILTERDMLHYLGSEKVNPREAIVQDLMTCCVLCIDIDGSLEVAGSMMEDGNFRHLPVTENEQVVGILSARDIFKAFHGQSTIKIKQLEAVKAMAVTYAHEINDPLMIITSSLKKVSKEIDHPKLSVASRNAQRIADVINKITNLNTLRIDEYAGGRKMVNLKDS